MFACYISAPAMTPREGRGESPGPQDFITSEYFNVVKGPNWPSLWVDCRYRQCPSPQSALKQGFHLRALTYNPFNVLDEQKKEWTTKASTATRTKTQRENGGALVNDQPSQGGGTNNRAAPICVCLCLCVYLCMSVCASLPSQIDTEQKQCCFFISHKW